MSGRTYNKEIMQWGYVALVCVALAFTTISGAAANTKSANLKPASDTGKWGACLAHDGVGELTDRQVCESNRTPSPSEGLDSVLKSVLVNASLNSYTPLIPSRERSAE